MFWEQKTLGKEKLNRMARKIKLRKSTLKAQQRSNEENREPESLGPAIPEGGRAK